MSSAAREQDFKSHGGKREVNIPRDDKPALEARFGYLLCAMAVGGWIETRSAKVEV